MFKDGHVDDSAWRNFVHLQGSEASKDLRLEVR